MKFKSDELFNKIVKIAFELMLHANRKFNKKRTFFKKKTAHRSTINENNIFDRIVCFENYKLFSNWCQIRILRKKIIQKIKWYERMISKNDDRKKIMKFCYQHSQQFWTRLNEILLLIQFEHNIMRLITRKWYFWSNCVKHVIIYIQNDSMIFLILCEMKKKSKSSNFALRMFSMKWSMKKKIQKSWCRSWRKIWKKNDYQIIDYICYHFNCWSRFAFVICWFKFVIIHFI